MTAWLLADEVLARIEARADTPLSVEQHCELQALAASRRRPAARSGSTAEVLVEGVLTKRPHLVSMLLGLENTTYPSIVEDLRAAERDPGTRRISLLIDSPGGEVDGLFDTLAVLQELSKPVTVRASNAQSAAYAIAAVAGKIEAESTASTFGSLGVAVDRIRSPNLLSLTNTDSPNKRPNWDADDGKAIVRKHLDDIFGLFVDAIATARGISEQRVRTGFGRGATLLAGEAKRAGMIDSIRKSTQSRTAATSASPASADSEYEPVVQRMLAQIELAKRAPVASDESVGMQAARIMAASRGRTLG